MLYQLSYRPSATEVYGPHTWSPAVGIRDFWPLVLPMDQRADGRVTEWLEPHDGVYFLLEERTTPYHLAALMLLDGPAPSHEEVERTIVPRLEYVPRARQRLEFAALTGRAAWVEDTSFDPNFHIRRSSLDPPGHEEQLKQLVASLMAQHLDRARPLWELWVIDGLAGGRSAALMKVHHAAVDGLTGTRDLARLFDESSPSPESKGPAESPVPAELLTQSLWARATTPQRVGASLLRGIRDPSRLLEVGTAAGLGVLEVIKAAVNPAPKSPMNRPIGPNRSFELVVSRLDTFRDIRARHGGTVNDVILAVTAAGLRRWYIERGEPVDGVTLRALVPMALRGNGDTASAGNAVTGVLAPLPLGESDPVRRLALIRSATLDPGLRRQAAGTSALLELPAIVPGPLARQIASIQRSQRFFNLSVTNMRGPAEPLRLAGRRIEQVVPLAPLSGNAGLIVAALSYAGQMNLGLLADPDTVPDLDLIAEGIDKAIVELDNT